MQSLPSETDPDGVGYSLANVADILLGCLDAREATDVVEIGAFRGDLTRVLLAWAGDRDARVIAVDPTPPDDLLELARQHPELELVEQTSHEALRHLTLPDAVIIDGDHNYYTVSEELRLIDEAASGLEFPLVMFHDVCWPHARRDTYLAPERIPEQHRQPLAHRSKIMPGKPGLSDAGLYFECLAEREGGPRNGVLTAVEDYMRERGDVRLAIVPAFFGLGVLWHRDAPWAGAVAEVLAPLDRNPVLERLEANRVLHLTARMGIGAQLADATDLNSRQAEQLRRMLASRAFTVAEWLSRLRQGGTAVISRGEVRRALGDENGSGAGS